MAPVFVDTSVWYAAADAGDAHRDVAQSLLAEHAGTLVTSDLVLGELWNLITARSNHALANRVIDAIAAGIAQIECTTHADFEAAQTVQADYPDQAFSLTDRTSWALMERLAITQALAFDTDFRVYRYGPRKTQAFAVHP